MSAGPALELEHAIGFSTAGSRLLKYHPTDPNKYITVLGACAVIGDFTDSHNQVFLRGHDDSITCLAQSSRGTLLATGQTGENADVIVWHFHESRLLFRFSEHDYGITDLAFSDDERMLGTVGHKNDRKLMIWDMYTGKIVTSVTSAPLPCDCIVWGGMVRDIKRRDTSLYQLATAGNRQLLLWSLDPFSGEMAAERVNTGAAVREYSCLQFAPDRELLFAGTRSGDVLCINVRNKLLAHALLACRVGVGDMLVRDGSLVVGGGDGTLSVWRYSAPRDEQATFTLTKRADALPGGVCAVDVVATGSEALVATAGGALLRARLDSRDAIPVALAAHSACGPVTSVAFARGLSDRFATCSADGALRVWNANNYSVEAEVSVRDAGAPSCVVYTLETLISGWADGCIRCHTATDVAGRACGELLWTIHNAHKGGVTAVLLSGNSRFLLSGGEDGGVRVWEMRSRELVSHLKEHTARVTGLALFHDDVHAMSCSRDRSILCWDLRNEKRVSSQTQRMGGVNCVALTQDQRLVLTVGQEKRITFWDLRDPNPVNQVDNAHGTGEALCIAVAHGGRTLATGGSDGRVRLWDATSARMLADGIGHSAPVRGVAFSPDDRQLVSVGEDGGVLVWNVFA